MSFTISASGTVLPSPTTFTANDEIIWSSDTGRTLSGYMIGDVIAEKKNVSVGWKWLTEDEVAVIKTALRAGWFTFAFRDADQNLSLQVYRGTLSKEAAGYIDDTFYYKSVSVDIIQR